jgi:hypothetical protein
MALVRIASELGLGIHEIITEKVEVLDRRDGEAYVHYVNTDKRMDEWVSDSLIRPLSASTPSAAEGSLAGHKRKRSWQVRSTTTT